MGERMVLVPNGVSIMGEEELVMAMSMHSDIYMVTKAIEAGQVQIDLYKADLLRDDEREKLNASGELGKMMGKKDEVPW
jgi:hypothetical protein